VDPGGDNAQGDTREDVRVIALPRLVRFPVKVDLAERRARREHASTLEHEGTIGPTNHSCQLDWHRQRGDLLAVCALSRNLILKRYARTSV